MQAPNKIPYYLGTPILPNKAYQDVFTLEFYDMSVDKINKSRQILYSLLNKHSKHSAIKNLSNHEIWLPQQRYWALRAHISVDTSQFCAYAFITLVSQPVKVEIRLTVVKIFAGCLEFLVTFFVKLAKETNRLQRFVNI